MSTVRRIAVLGSTGSIGTQTLEVIAAQPEHFVVDSLIANNNWELLVKQARQFIPNQVVIGNTDRYQQVREALHDLPIKVFAGADAIEQVVAMESCDVVLTAYVGFAGLKPTLSAIEAGKTIALANKETLVVAGDLVTAKAKEKGINIYPVDSEHSAIFQCLAGEWHNTIEKIYLTASGGPFRGKKRSDLESITLEQALKHPNWTMGAKITIDSASLMNKGLEVIEAKWLFNLTAEQIDVIVHPQSIIHSIIQTTDGSMKAQMGLPDMKLPIQYALSYPHRLTNDFPRFNFLNYPQLTFEAPDFDTFENLGLAFDALRKGGNMPCILNASNEIAVESFLAKQISFLDMPALIARCMQDVPFISKPSLSDYFDTDTTTRALARELVVKKVLA